MGKAFPKQNVLTVELNAQANKTNPHASYAQEPIAIVGMAVNMPGAPSASKLWELLEQGINTIAEVNVLFCRSRG